MEEADLAKVDESPFVAWLLEQNYGALLDELDEGLTELNRHVRELVKSGTLTLTIGVSTKGARLIISDDVKVKLPKPDKTSQLYYVDDDGVLHTEDPKQERLDLQILTPATPLRRVVNEDTGEITDPAADIDKAIKKKGSAE